MNDFFDQIQIYQKSVEKALALWLPDETLPPRNLHEAMRYSVLAEGKRIRPILVYATGQAFDVELESYQVYLYSELLQVPDSLVHG